MASILPQRDSRDADAGSGMLGRYGPVIAVSLVVALILAIHVETAVSLVAIWQRSDTYAHGFVVVPICLWLAWRNRRALSAVHARPWLTGLLFVGGAGALWLVMSAADVVAGRQFALVFMLQAAIVTVIGLPAARAIAFPLAFLLFAVPFGEFLVPAMIDMTADFTVAALRISGVPVYREGNHFIIPSGAWSVVEACSGLRYLIASVMIGVLYAAISYRSPRRRAGFVAASILVPLVANWLRAYLIVMLGHLSNNKLAVGVDHLIYGWLFFGLVMGLLFWIGSFWNEAPAGATETGAGPVTTRVETPSRFFVAALLAFGVAALWRPLQAEVAAPPLSTPVTIAQVVPAAGWAPVADSPLTWKPDYSNFSADASQAFAKGNAVANVYIAYYRDQRKGRELVTTANQLVLPQNHRWRTTLDGVANVTLEGRERKAWRAEVAGDRDMLVAYRLYWIDGRLSATDTMAKAMLAWSRLTGGTGDAALVVVYAREREGHESAREALEQLWPSIERALDATRKAN